MKPALIAKTSLVIALLIPIECMFFFDKYWRAAIQEHQGVCPSCGSISFAAFAITLIFALVSIVLGSIALSKIKLMRDKEGRNMAWAALLISGASFLILILSYFG